MKDYPFLDISIRTNIAFVALNRPEKANALHRDLWTSLKSFFMWVKEISDIHVVVLSGHGKHFCSGIDLHFLRDTQQTLKEQGSSIRQSNIKTFILDLQETFNAMELCHKPVIAAIHGQCIGAGVDLIAACDIRYATQDAQFSIKEVDFGIVSDTGALQRLPHLISYGTLSELAYTGREFGAEEAMQIGIINRCFPELQTLLETSHQIAKTIASKNTMTVQGIKETLLYAREHSVKNSLEQVAAWNAKTL